jgi:hypothetical protein
VTSCFDVKSASAALARSHDLLAIVTTRLALLLRAVGQELPRILWLLTHYEREFVNFRKPAGERRGSLNRKIKPRQRGAGVFAETSKGEKLDRPANVLTAALNDRPG